MNVRVCVECKQKKYAKPQHDSGSSSSSSGSGHHRQHSQQQMIVSQPAVSRTHPSETKTRTSIHTLARSKNITHHNTTRPHKHSIHKNTHTRIPIFSEFVKFGKVVFVCVVCVDICKVDRYIGRPNPKQISLNYCDF